MLRIFSPEKNPTASAGSEPVILGTRALDMVVLPSTGASRYHNGCRDGGTSPEYFGNDLVHRTLIVVENQNK
jgi:hypothetical protein